MTAVALLTVVLLAVPLGLGVLTGLGARRRGRPVLLAVVAGLLFPLTWAVWYVRDERPWSPEAVTR